MAKFNDKLLVKNVYIDFELLNSKWKYGICDNAERYCFKFLDWDDIDLGNTNRMIGEDDSLVRMISDTIKKSAVIIIREFNVEMVDI